MFTSLMLYYASKQREETTFQIAELLLRAHTNVNARDRAKMTFLYVATLSTVTSGQTQDLRGRTVIPVSVIVYKMRHICCCVGSLFRGSERTYFSVTQTLLECCVDLISV